MAELGSMPDEVELDSSVYSMPGVGDTDAVGSSARAFMSMDTSSAHDPPQKNAMRTRTITNDQDSASVGDNDSGYTSTGGVVTLSSL